MVERPLWERDVAGSIPVRLTQRRSLWPLLNGRAGGCELPSAGSSPVGQPTLLCGVMAARRALDPQVSVRLRSQVPVNQRTNLTLPGQNARVDACAIYTSGVKCIKRASEGSRTLLAWVEATCTAAMPRSRHKKTRDRHSVNPGLPWSFGRTLDSAALGVGPGGSSRGFGAGCAGSRNSAGIAASNARSVFIALGAGEG